MGDTKPPATRKCFFMKPVFIIEEPDLLAFVPTRVRPDILGLLTTSFNRDPPD